MKSVMVDIETLSTAKDAAVISIGICAFNESGVIGSDGWAIHHSDWHGDINPATIKWWMNQNECAREFSFKGSMRAHEVAANLGQFVKTWGGGVEEDEVWANDPDFDVVILQSWWQRVTERSKLNIGRPPFHYRASRSCRTIFAEAQRLGIWYDGAAVHSVAHHPVDDACNQARGVIQVRRNLIGATA